MIIIMWIAIGLLSLQLYSVDSFVLRSNVKLSWPFHRPERLRSSSSTTLSARKRDITELNANKHRNAYTSNMLDVSELMGLSLDTPSDPGNLVLQSFMQQLNQLQPPEDNIVMDVDKGGSPLATRHSVDIDDDDEESILDISSVYDHQLTATNFKHQQQQTSHMLAKIAGLRSKRAGRHDIGPMTDKYSRLEERSNYQTMFELMMESYNKDSESYTNPMPMPSERINVTMKHWSDREDGIYVDYGGKSFGFIPLQELVLTPETSVSLLKDMYAPESVFVAEVVGESRSRRYGSGTGYNSPTLILSVREMHRQQIVERMHAAVRDGRVMNVTFVAFNKGGAVCDCFGITCFIPSTQLLPSVDAKATGTVTLVKFINYNADRDTFICSQAAATPVNVVPGSLQEGAVTHITDFGVFVALPGGLQGLLHNSEISRVPFTKIMQERVMQQQLSQRQSQQQVVAASAIAPTQPGSAFKKGQKVKVVVKSVVNGRISLCTRVLERSPGEMYTNMQAVFAHAEETMSADEQVQGPVLSQRFVATQSVVVPPPAIILDAIDFEMAPSLAALPLDVVEDTSSKFRFNDIEDTANKDQLKGLVKDLSKTQLTGSDRAKVQSPRQSSVSAQPNTARAKGPEYDLKNLVTRMKSPPQPSPTPNAAPLSQPHAGRQAHSASHQQQHSSPPRPSHLPPRPVRQLPEEHQRKGPSSNSGTR
jgi:hypothetical protein